MTSLARTVPALARTVPALARTVPALARAAAGAAGAAADGLAPLGDALVTIYAPLVIVAAQVLGTLAALRLTGSAEASTAGPDGPPSRAGGAILVLLACTASLVAVAFDGDVGHAGASAPQVAYQVLIAALTAVTWAGVVAHLAPRLLRRTSTAH